MLPQDPVHLVAMSDTNSDEDGEVATTPDVEQFRSGVGTPDVKDDAISVISEVNSTKSTKSKKKVQFLPDGFLVRVREIPPRSNKSSSESDGSASESSSGSDDSDADSDSDHPSDRDTPSPAGVESNHTFTTMPPLLYNRPHNSSFGAAKGSYSTAKSGSKSGNIVAKITGIVPRPVSPSSPKNTSKRSRRTPSPKLDKRPKRTPAKQTLKSSSTHQGVKTNQESSNKTTKPEKKPVTTKKVGNGKISPVPLPKQSKSGAVHSSSKTNMPSQLTTVKLSLAQRRVNSAPPNKISASKPRKNSATISTSVTLLPDAHQSGNPADKQSVKNVGRAMQSLTMNQLYTVDGFIFPSELHLPKVLRQSEEDNFSNHQSLNGSKFHVQNMVSGSPRRSLDLGQCGDHGQQTHSDARHSTSPSLANRKKRYYAWQMANGSLQNTLQNTPSIAQLWDTAPDGLSGIASSSNSVAKGLSNNHHRR